MSDRTHFTDTDLKSVLDGRIRQLEAELEANLIQAAESAADPHDDSGPDQFQKNVESLEARLTVVRGRRDDVEKKTPTRNS